MQRVRSYAMLLTLALAAACEEPCKDACQRRFADCMKGVQTAEQKSICDYNASACMQRCPQGQQPQYEVPPDE